MNKLTTTFFFLTLFLLASCTATPEPAPPTESAAAVEILTIEILSPIFPPVVGVSDLVLKVTETATGQPVSDAYLSVKGDMDHNGMVPVLSSAKTGNAGEYVIPFEWTMGGDWILNVNATLPDGSFVETNFNLAVDGDEVTCAPIASE